MKIRNIILLSILGIILVAAIYFLVRRASNNQANINVFQAIPDDADGIAVLNVEAFMSLFFSNLGDVWELKDEFEGNRRTKELNNELQLSGINLSRKVVLYMTGNKFNVLVPISSEEKFQDYLMKLDEDTPLKSLGNNQYYSSELGGFISFNDKVCFLSQCSNSETSDAQIKWNEIKNPTNEKRVLSSTISELAESDQHFSFYMKEDEMAERSPFFDHSPAGVTSLTFEDGLIRIKSTLSTANSDVQNPLISGGQSLANDKYMNLHVNLNLSADWSYWLSEQGKYEFEGALDELGISKAFIDSWKGNFNLALTGIETVTEEVVSYDYDENFNKIEKKELGEVKKLGYQISYTGEETDFEMKGLDILGIGSGQSSSIDNTQFYTSNGENPEVSNTNNSGISLVMSPKNMLQLAIDQGFGLAALGQSYSDLIDKISITSNPNGQSIESEAIITLSDKEKNSLIYLIGAMQRGF